MSQSLSPNIFSLKSLTSKLTSTAYQYVGEDFEFKGFSIDTRTLKPGELFVALSGEKVNGHDFINTAIEKGACGVLLSNNLILNQINQSRPNFPIIWAQDVRRALGELSHHWRMQFKSCCVIGLTGSCGKTGTKEMIASILSEMGPTLATLGNKNNDLGVPLTLGRLTSQHQFAVIEMGTNQPGEIGYLTKLVQPNMALITNINAAHLEGFGSFENLIQEKSDLYANLPSNGIAILNSDESFASALSNRLEQQHRVTFGVTHDADVAIKDLDQNAIEYDLNGVNLDLKTPLGPLNLKIPLLGEHVVYNALASIATSLTAGASLEAVKLGLEKLTPMAGRFKPYRLDAGALLIDDTYNASASSVENALKSLSRFKGRKIFIMSNMGELGDFSEQYHQKMGEWIDQYQIDHALLTGDIALLKPTIEACESSKSQAEYFGSKELLIQKACDLIDSKTIILVKGSRSNQMESIVQKLLEI